MNKRFEKSCERITNDYEQINNKCAGWKEACSEITSGKISLADSFQRNPREIT
jgi:hypothetical protein